MKLTRRRESKAGTAGLLVHFCICVLLLVQTAGAKNIVIFAPHPDDEALMASGIIYAALKNGDTVKVVVVANGDFRGVQRTPIRQAETIAAMARLGLSEQDVIFLGYGDGALWKLYNSSSPSAVLSSPAGRTHTYGSRGLGATDYHSYLHHRPGSYNRKTVLDDFRSVLTKFRPSDIYTTSFYDDHLDHRATNGFVIEALVTLARSRTPLRARLHETFVHDPGSCTPGPTCGSMGWPRPVFTPDVPFPRPPAMDAAPYRWEDIESIPVPSAMQNADAARNPKYLVLAEYVSQAPPAGHSNWLQAFVKRNEFFWVRDFADDLALTASISASSEASAARNVADGVIAGDPVDGAREWASDGERAAWIKLAWKSPVKIGAVILHDRPDLRENVTSGTLRFSDGSELRVGTLPQNGAGLPISFPPKTIEWVQFRVDDASGPNPGLAEIEVFGVPAGSTVSTLPLIVRGPQPVPAMVESLATSRLGVDAFDPGGAQLSYSWTADGGTITGSGPTAVFQAPETSKMITCAVTVSVDNGHGGITRNSTFITITPKLSLLRGIEDRLRHLWQLLKAALGKLHHIFAR